MQVLPKGCKERWDKLSAKEKAKYEDEVWDLVDSLKKDGVDIHCIDMHGNMVKRNPFDMLKKL